MRTKKDISAELEKENIKLTRLTSIIGQDSAEYERTKDIDLKNSINKKLLEIQALQERIQLLTAELNAITE